MSTGERPVSRSDSALSEHGGLTEQARNAINAYLLHKSVWAISGFSVISFLAGFAINEVARSQAYVEALDSYSQKFVDMAERAGQAQGAIEHAAEVADGAAARAEALRLRVVEIHAAAVNEREELARVIAQLGTSGDKIAAELLKVPEFRESIAQALLSRSTEETERINSLETRLNDSFDLDGSRIVLKHRVTFANGIADPLLIYDNSGSYLSLRSFGSHGAIENTAPMGGPGVVEVFGFSARERE